MGFVGAGAGAGAGAASRAWPLHGARCSVSRSSSSSISTLHLRIHVWKLLLDGSSAKPLSNASFAVSNSSRLKHAVLQVIAERSAAPPRLFVCDNVQSGIPFAQKGLRVTGVQCYRAVAVGNCICAENRNGRCHATKPWSGRHQVGAHRGSFLASNARLHD